MTAKLIPITCEPLGKGIAEVLDKMREMVDKGEISSLAIAYVFRDGCTGLAHSAMPSRSTLIGAIERLKYKLLKDGE